MGAVARSGIPGNPIYKSLYNAGALGLTNKMSTKKKQYDENDLVCPHCNFTTTDGALFGQHMVGRNRSGNCSNQGGKRQVDTVFIDEVLFDEKDLAQTRTKKRGLVLEGTGWPFQMPDDSTGVVNFKLDVANHVCFITFKTGEGNDIEITMSVNDAASFSHSLYYHAEQHRSVS